MKRGGGSTKKSVGSETVSVYGILGRELTVESGQRTTTGSGLGFIDQDHIASRDKCTAFPFADLIS